MVEMVGASGILQRPGSLPDAGGAGGGEGCPVGIGVAAIGAVLL